MHFRTKRERELVAGQHLASVSSALCSLGIAVGGGLDRRVLSFNIVLEDGL